MSTTVTALTCEYLPSPLGIDVPRPRLSWQLQADRRGARQVAYQVQVATSLEALLAGEPDAWDSGRTDSSASVHIPYGGPPLGSGAVAHWRVRVWDEQGVASEWGAPARWEVGLLQPEDWRAEWIAGPLAGGTWTTSPCPFMRKDLYLTSAVTSARLYATALGLYEAYINGVRVGEDHFTPGWTDYRKRVQYRVYDVTHLLRQGDNTLGAILGDGWYCGHVEWRGRQRWGDRPALRAQVVVELADGTRVVVGTDGTWLTTYGPLLEADLLMGESYDARREMPGWCAPGFDASAWRPAEVMPAPPIEVSASTGPPVRAHEEIAPIADPHEHGGLPTSKWVFDLGQNMVGRVRLRVKGPAGATVTLRHAEVLNPDGTLYTVNLRSARQTDHYTLKGEGEEVWEPRFTFHGFRYVEVGGFPGTPTRDAITGIVLHSDTPPTGEFTCSDPLVSQLQHNIVWGQKGNFLEVPTDCPQRDERLGWTGDAQVFIRTAAFNMNVAPFFHKWLRDVRDAQNKQGAVPPIVPNTGVVGADGGPAWSDAAIICPWTVYLCYGDTAILEDNYEAMRGFVEYLRATSRDHIRCYPGYEGFTGFGDWLSINAETPHDLIGTAFYAYSARLLSQVAAVLGKADDARAYADLCEQVRQAFVHRYITPEGLLAPPSQTACVLALHFDLAPEDLRTVIAETLVDDIRRRGMHLSAGFVGSPYIARALSDHGRLDIAYAVLHQTSWPSWLYSVTRGATTIWERWDGWTEDKGFQDPGMNSFNHYAYGAIGAWLYAVAAGIDADPAQPGFKRALLAPRPGGKLTSASAALETPYGRLSSAWKLEEGAFTWDVTVPPNTTALARVPGLDVQEASRPAADAAGVTVQGTEGGAVTLELAAGHYQFTSRMEA